MVWPGVSGLPSRRVKAASDATFRAPPAGGGGDTSLPCTAPTACHGARSNGQSATPHASTAAAPMRTSSNVLAFACK